MEIKHLRKYRFTDCHYIEIVKEKCVIYFLFLFFHFKSYVFLGISKKFIIHIAKILEN